jgi:3-hydroxyacyl-[acyl-carrier-protein] dehydratase
VKNLRALIDPRQHPLDRIFMTQEEVMRRNPQRHEFLQVESILHCSLEQNLIVGHRRVRSDEFWVRGHLPGRPLLPGLMMCETLAQVASIHAHLELKLPEHVFMGFGALDKVRFRVAVAPPCDLWVAGRILKASATRPYFSWSGQILREDGTIVTEGEIVGVGM